MRVLTHISPHLLPPSPSPFPAPLSPSPPHLWSTPLHPPLSINIRTLSRNSSWMGTGGGGGNQTKGRRRPATAHPLGRGTRQTPASSGVLGGAWGGQPLKDMGTREHGAVTFRNSGDGVGFSGGRYLPYTESRPRPHSASVHGRPPLSRVSEHGPGEGGVVGGGGDFGDEERADEVMGWWGGGVLGCVLFCFIYLT